MRWKGLNKRDNGSTSKRERHTTSYQYDSLNRPIGSVDAQGHRTVLAYDPAGNLTDSLDANGHTTHFQYDAANRLVAVGLPDGSTRHSSYDADGNQTKVLDGNGNPTTMTYDALDRLSSVTDALGHTTSYQYDGVGNLLTQVQPGIRTTSYRYDLRNRLTNVVDPAGRHTGYDYNQTGNLLHSIDGNGNVTTYQYNTNSLLTGVLRPDGVTLNTYYDAADNIVQQTDGNGLTTSYTYDALNRPLTMTTPRGTTHYGYDHAGNLTGVMDPMQRLTTLAYDQRNQLTGTSYSDGVTPNVSYSYTPTGQRASMTDGTGTTTYGYDGLDRLTGVTSGSGQHTGYGYDGAGNVTTLTYPDGSQVQRGYDQAERLTSIKDWLQHSSSFQYDNVNSLVGESLANGVQVSLSYDAGQALQHKVYTSPGGSTLWSFDYTRDGQAQVTGSTDTLTGSQTAGYDKLNRLTSLGGTKYTYDPAHALTGVSNTTTGQSRTLSYAANAQLSSQQASTNSTPTANTSYSYNGNGDRTSASDSVSGASASYSYDQADQLTGATVGGTTASYSYDGDGLRQSKTVAGASTSFAYDQAEGLPSVLQAGSTKYVTGPDGLPLEQVGSTGSVQYYAQDQQGSTRGLLDASGQSAATFSYDPYGALTAHTGSASTPFGYTGQFTDVETGLQYLQARYYDPASAQFLTRDPLESMTQQPYAYTAGNPLNFSDPTGLSWCGPCDQAGNYKDHPTCDTCGAAGSAIHRRVDEVLRDLASTPQGRAMLIAMNNFDNLDFATIVNKEALQFVQAAQGIYQGVAFCVHDPTGCKNTAGALAEYLSDPRHRQDVLGMLAQSSISGIADVIYDINCGFFGAAAGHLLVDFVTLKGGEVLKNLLKDAARWVKDGAALGCALCFPAGTQVATPAGSVAIEKLHVGDKVLAENPTTHKVDTERVEALIVHQDRPLMQVNLSDGSSLKVTPDHPFYVDTRANGDPGGWVTSWQLRLGDRLRTANGKDVTVSGVRYNVGTATVYTLTVAVDHTFFVGSARVLVHNATCDSVLLARAMAKVRRIRRDFKGWAAHHIVPNKGGGDWGAMARALLKEWGIPINDAFNGVFLPGVSTSKYHYYGAPGIHTDAYFETVYLLLLELKSEGATAEDVRGVLTVIGQDLRAGNFPY